jgi:hypothetical protein
VAISTIKVLNLHHWTPGTAQIGAGPEIAQKQKQKQKQKQQDLPATGA